MAQPVALLLVLLQLSTMLVASCGGGVAIPRDYRRWTIRHAPSTTINGASECTRQPAIPATTPCISALNATCGYVRGPQGRSVQCEGCCLEHTSLLTAAGCNTSYEIQWCNSTAPPPLPPVIISSNCVD